MPGGRAAYASHTGSRLIFEGGKQYVVCVGTDNRLRVREVGVYKQTDEYCYPNAGLKEGDVVVNKNALLVYNALK